MSNKYTLIDATIGVKCFGTGRIDVKEVLSDMGVAVTPKSEEHPGFNVYQKRLYEDNPDFDFEENNGVIDYTQVGEPKDQMVTIVIEVENDA